MIEREAMNADLDSILGRPASEHMSAMFRLGFSEGTDIAADTIEGLRTDPAFLALSADSLMESLVRILRLTNDALREKNGLARKKRADGT